MAQLGLLDFIFPSRCAVCEAPGANLCQGCQFVLRPFPHRFVRGPVVGLAATYLSPEVSKLVVAFKDGGQSALIGEFRELLAPLVTELQKFPGAFYLVPAPSRVQNFSRRGFTPGVLLARALANQVGGARVMNCLGLASTVKDQVGLTGIERAQNLSGSMSLNQPVAGKICYLVDDIATTGATLIEAWRALSTGGATVLGALVLSESKANSTG